MPTPRQILDALIDQFAPEIRAAFEAAIADIVDNVTLNDVIKAIEDGDIERAFQTLGYSPAAMRPISAAIESAFERGGVATGDTFPKRLNTPNGKAVFRFDVRNSRAEAWLRDKSSTLISRIGDETRANVRTIVTRGMQAGTNPRNVALDIIGRIDRATGKRVGGIVGLTPNQEFWVASARNKLEHLDAGYFKLSLRDKRFDSTVQAAINDGKPLPSDTIDKLITRYKDNALKYRGETIARTEAMQSLNASEYEAIRQAIDMGAINQSNVQRIWDSAGDKRVRDTHRHLDGQSVGFDEPFVSESGARLLYPGDTSLGADAAEIINCRCRARLKVDWLADLN